MRNWVVLLIPYISIKLAFKMCLDVKGFSESPTDHPQWICRELWDLILISWFHLNGRRKHTPSDVIETVCLFA